LVSEFFVALYEIYLFQNPTKCAIVVYIQYIVNCLQGESQMSYITVIGAANMDIIAKPFRPIIPHDSNPGRISTSHGGVGRNIAENLARLGADVKLVAAVGNDSFGKELLESCKTVGIDTDYCYLREDAATPTYLAVLDEHGEMYVAAVDVSCTLPTSHIQTHADIISNSRIVFMDTNLEQEMLEHLLDIFKHNDLYVDPISATKARKIKHLVGRFHTIKMNRLEAEVLTDISISTDAKLQQAGNYFMEQGTKRIIISLGAEGLYYRTNTQEIRLRPEPIIPKNATGAGDALMAGIAYCSLHGKSDAYTANFAQAMAQIALMSEQTVSPNMSLNEVITLPEKDCDQHEQLSENKR